jgi:hypothetical protein
MIAVQGVIGSDISDVVLPLRRIKWQASTKKASTPPIAFAEYQGRDDVVGKMVGGVRYSNNDYSQMLKELFDQGDVCKHTIDTGAVSAIKSIGPERMQFVTSLKKDAVGHIHSMFQNCGLSMQITSTNGRSKLPHVKSFAAFIDNDPKELDEMRGLVPVRILFDMYGDTSSKTQSTPRGVERAESWSQVLRILQKNNLLRQAA